MKTGRVKFPEEQIADQKNRKNRKDKYYIIQYKGCCLPCPEDSENKAVKKRIGIGLFIKFRLSANVLFIIEGPLIAHAGLALECDVLAYIQINRFIIKDTCGCGAPGTCSGQIRPLQQIGEERHVQASFRRRFFLFP